LEQSEFDLAPNEDGFSLFLIRHNKKTLVLFLTFHTICLFLFFSEFLGLGVKSLAPFLRSLGHNQIMTKPSERIKSLTLESHKESQILAELDTLDEKITSLHKITTAILDKLTKAEKGKKK
jgi:hypothetical protein